MCWATCPSLTSGSHQGEDSLQQHSSRARLGEDATNRKRLRLHEHLRLGGGCESVPFIETQANRVSNLVADAVAQTDDFEGHVVALLRDDGVAQSGCRCSARRRLLRREVTAVLLAQ